MLLLAFMNRAQPQLRPALERLFLYVGGTVLCESLLIKLEYISRSDQHNALFYTVVGMGTPFILAALAIASERRWACTIMTAVYTAFALGFLWILPLFPAEPKLGPVYRQVTTFIPPEFPLLLVVPAFALDLLRPRFAKRSAWLHAIVAGVSFMAVFVAVQWPFANFLMSPLARNWFFGAIYFDYN